MRSLGGPEAQRVPECGPSGAVDTPSGRGEARGNLSLSTQLAFSAQGTFGAAMAMLTTVYLGKFYLDVVLLPAGLYAIAIASGRVLDAIAGPVLGYLSDHTRSPFGRRKPFIAVGVLGYALLFYWMLTPDPELSLDEAMVHFTGCYLASLIFMTAALLPRTALAVEQTLDAGERTRLFGLIALFIGVGAIIGAAGPFLWEGVWPEPRPRMRGQAEIYVVFYIFLNAWFLFKVSERADYRGRGEVPFVPGVRRALRNRPFRKVLLSHLLTAAQMATPATLMPFFVQYLIKASAEWTVLFTVTYLASGALSLPLWLLLARRVGKLRVWWWAASVGITGGLAMGILGEGDQWLMLVLEAYVGTQSLVFYAIGGAMHADAIDYDELRNGTRREAQMGALWSLVPKVAFIPGAAVPLAILGAVGYAPNQEQSQVVVDTMRLLFAFAPALLNGLGLLVMWWYPLSEEVHLAVREGVERHRRGQHAIDPLTGRLLSPAGSRAVDPDTAWFLDFFSSRELRNYLAGETGLLTSVITWVIATGVLTLSCVSMAMFLIKDLEHEPGPLPSLAIVLAGAGLSAFLFQLLRIAPARRLSDHPIDLAVIAQHLRDQ